MSESLVSICIEPRVFLMKEQVGALLVTLSFTNKRILSKIVKREEKI